MRPTRCQLRYRRSHIKDIADHPTPVGFEPRGQSPGRRLNRSDNVSHTRPKRICNLTKRVLNQPRPVIIQCAFRNFLHMFTGALQSHMTCG